VKKGLQKTLSVAMACLALSANVVLASPDKAWSLEGFDEPESVLVHPTKPLLFVSNVNGHPAALNGKGYISLLSDEGKVIRHVWVNGMDAPKGLAMDEKYLYVADMQQMHIVDHEKGELVKSIKAEGSVMLNDVVIDDKGVVYLSDILGGGVYRYENDALTKWISAEALPHPNGLLFNHGQLTVATWGTGLHEDFTTDVLGGLSIIDRDTKQITAYKNAEAFGNLDGIAEIKGALFVSDWMNGNIFKYKDQKLELLFNEPKKFTGDLSSKGDLLFVPLMFSQRIDVYKIEP